MRILLIEDDLMIGGSLAQALKQQGMSIDWVRTGRDGHEALETGGHSIVLLDLCLPGTPGLTILKAARRAGNRVPVLVITARDGLDDRIAGLDVGADDYLVKPFEMGAVLRRHGGFAQSLLEAGEITLDLASHEVAYRGKRLLLPAREFMLMQVLMERPGAIRSRAQVEERLYGWGEEVESNAVDVLIHSIRKKFDKDIIRNVRGAGWMIVKSAP